MMAIRRLGWWVGVVEVDELGQVVGDAGACCCGLEPREPGEEERGWGEDGGEEVHFGFGFEDRSSQGW